VFDAASKQVSAFVVPKSPWAFGGPAFVAVTAGGKIFVASKRAIWAEDAHGDLALRFRSKADAIHGLVASGDRIWFADGAELGVIEDGRVRETSGANVSPDAEIVGSPSGDVWTLTGGALARYETPNAASADWNETVAPVLHRVCETCHRAGGEAGVSLATEESWEKRRETIRRRVLVDRDMPPPPRTLSEADRGAIRAWIER
jgi:mono/diheme cytochrome c family protein